MHKCSETKVLPANHKFFWAVSKNYSQTIDIDSDQW